MRCATDFLKKCGDRSVVVQDVRLGGGCGCVTRSDDIKADVWGDGMILVFGGDWVMTATTPTLWKIIRHTWS